MTGGFDKILRLFTLSVQTRTQWSDRLHKRITKAEFLGEDDDRGHGGGRRQ